MVSGLTTVDTERTDIRNTHTMMFWPIRVWEQWCKSYQQNSFIQGMIGNFHKQCCASQFSKEWNRRDCKNRAADLVVLPNPNVITETWRYINSEHTSSDKRILEFHFSLGGLLGEDQFIFTSCCGFLEVVSHPVIIAPVITWMLWFTC